MKTLVLPYAERQHSFFGNITRPVVSLDLYSERFGRWFVLNNVLVDTGADITVIPFPLGEILMTDIQYGQPIQLGRVVSSAAMFHAFVHRVQAQLGEITFEMPVAVAMTKMLPPIFGRKDALDRFSACFVKGQELIVEC